MMKTRSLGLFLALLLACSWGVTPLSAFASNRLSGSAISTYAEPSKIFTDENTEIVFQGGNSFVFSNTDIRPDINTVRLDGVAVPDSNYTKSYGTNNKNAGENTASVTITGINGYSGSCTKYFTIEKRDLRDVAVFFEGSYAYADEATINPEPTVVYNGNLQLDGASDYTVTYPSPSSNPGTYEAVITARAESVNFTGEKKAYYTITSRSIEGGSLEINCEQPSYYTGTEIDPQVAVKVGERTLEKGVDYELKIISQSTGKPVDAIVDAGSYTIVATGTGDKFTGELSQPFTVSQASMNNVAITLTPLEYEYDGTAKEPAIIAKNGEVDLIANTDFDAEYFYNVDPGNAKVMLLGKGNYNGFKTATFKINPKEEETDGGNGTDEGNGQGSGNGSNGNGNDVGEDANGTGNNGSGNGGNTSGGSGDDAGSGSNNSGTGDNGANDGNGAGTGLNGSSGTGGSSGADGSSSVGGASGADGASSGSGSGSESSAGASSDGVSSSGAAVSKTEAVTMYRLYNPNSGEHFYTASTDERRDLIRVGWNAEGIGWYAPKKGDAVYRLYNPFAGDHHYTTSVDEVNDLIDEGWRSEGVGWHSAGADGVPVYRQYNPNAEVGCHNYTTSKTERNRLVALGWRDEGVGWYGVRVAS